MAGGNVPCRVLEVFMGKRVDLRRAKVLAVGLVAGIWSLARIFAGAGALGLAVGSISFLISGEGFWNRILELSRSFGSAEVLYEHRSAAEGQSFAGGEGLLPDPRLTPGAVVKVDFAEMCKIGYAASVRDAGPELRNEVFVRYGLFWGHRRDYEIDHLIPLSLAGSNLVENEWPESRVTEPWNASVKDFLEDVLHREVCGGRVSLAEAQEAIRTDWIAAYKKYVGPEIRRFVPRSAGWSQW